MDGTYAVMMGDRGRLVIPADLRSRLHLEAGTPLVLVETPRGLLLGTREQVKILVRSQLAGADLVGDLISDRRRQAAAEDDE